MKKLFYIFIPLLLSCFIVGTSLLSQNKLQKNNVDKNININNQNNNEKDNSSDYVKQALKCKSCHATEYPTKKDPGLKDCPRKSMVSVYHSPLEGPEVVVINEMSDNYEGVVFSHRVHSQMAEMTTGCTGCHHYNTTGPVLNCRNCHENNRFREDVSVPDLKAAYHRQCLSCHKQWSHENGCNSQCHLRKGSDREKVIENIKGKTHPKLPEPDKMIWETNYEESKIVTFFHNEHTNLFKISCKSCHGQDNCIKCHETKNHEDFSKPVKIKKSFEDHHKPCINCHSGNYCQKCHKDKEMTPFNHSKTGWALKFYHSNLACAKCHGTNMPYKKLDNNCTSCHKNFVQGKFDHKSIGLTLSENHKGFDCKDCHQEGNFSANPKCSPCHDDKSYPAQLPGTKSRR